MGKTKEQDVIAAKEKIATLKGLFMQAITDYIDACSAKKNELSKLLICQQKANEYFNSAEEFVGNSDLLGAHQSPLWAQGFAEDCAEILKTIPSHIMLLKEGFAKYSNLESHHFVPSHAAYANMQRMVMKYLDGKIADDVKSVFLAAGLPVYGFKNEAKQFMSEKTKLYLSFSSGVSFIIILLIIALVKPNPTDFQYTVFRIVLSIAGCGVIGVAPGFIEVKFGNWLKAGGALAVFAIIYFCAPAVLP